MDVLTLHKKNPEAIRLLRRHRKPRENILGITRPAIRRLARRGGVLRMEAAIYNTTRTILHDRLSEILKRVVYVLDSASTEKHVRKVVTPRDIIYVLQTFGTTIYGFN